MWRLGLCSLGLRVAGYTQRPGACWGKGNDFDCHQNPGGNFLESEFYGGPMSCLLLRGTT